MVVSGFLLICHLASCLLSLNFWHSFLFVSVRLGVGGELRETSSGPPPCHTTQIVSGTNSELNREIASVRLLTREGRIYFGKMSASPNRLTSQRVKVASYRGGVVDNSASRCYF